MPPKRQPDLRRFLEKEITKVRSRIKHPDSSKNGGRCALTSSNLSAFEHRYVELVSYRLESPISERSPGLVRECSAFEPVTAQLDFDISPGSDTLGQDDPAAPVALRHDFEGSTSLGVNTAVNMAGRRYREFNSLFGDQDDGSVSTEPLEIHHIRNQKKQAQLEQLLAESSPKTPIPTFVESTHLRDLKSELKMLVFREAEGRMMEREDSLLQRQKNALIEEVRYMEGAERKAFDEIQRKKNQHQQFPEPVGPFEKKRPEWGRKRLERAKARAERSTKRRQGDVDDNNIDGEERLRLGKSLKPKPLHMTGHFWSTRHDYFPGMPGDRAIATESGALLEKTLRNFEPGEREAK